MPKWRIAVLYEIEAADEEDAWQKGDALVGGDESIDATYDGVWTERPDPTSPLGRIGGD